MVTILTILALSIATVSHADEGEVVKEMKGGKTKYTIPGRVYAEMPELLEELSNAELKQRLSAVGQKVGGKKAELVERLRDYMAEK